MYNFSRSQGESPGTTTLTSGGGGRGPALTRAGDRRVITEPGKIEIFRRSHTRKILHLITDSKFSWELRLL